MRRFSWVAGGILGACVALLVGFKVETTGNGGWPFVLPEWLFYLTPQTHLQIDFPPYSAPYWAIAGFLIGALWIALRNRD